jgi:hypothetical protein
VNSILQNEPENRTKALGQVIAANEHYHPAGHSRGGGVDKRKVIGYFSGTKDVLRYGELV